MNPKKTTSIPGTRKKTLKKPGNNPITEIELSESIINQLPGIFYLYDESGNFISWNKNFELVTGYKASEIRKMKPLDFYHKDQQEIIKNRIKTVFKKDVPGIEIELLSKQKKKRPFYINSKAVIYKGIRCLMGIGTDISKLKLTEQQLVDNHAVLNSILESTNSSVFSLDRKYRYTSFNKAHAAGMKKIYAVKIEVGKSILDYQTVKEDRLRAQRNINKALKGHQFIEYAYLGEPGLKRIYYEISHNPIFNAQGKVIGVSIFSNNITDRKLAEEALQKSEERYRLLIESANEGILVAQGGYLRFINKRVSDFMGYSEKKLLNTPFLEFIHPDSHELIIDIYRKRMLDQPVPRTYQVRIIHKDKSSRWVEFSGVKIDWKGEPAVMNFITDVTESRKISNDLVKINRLYAFISNCNNLILRTQDREKLFNEICRIAVDDGKFRMCWIGKLDEATLTVEPISWAGHEDGYLKKIKKINLINKTESNGPTGQSLKNGKTFFCNDIANDPRMNPWKKEALKRGYYSSISIPIKVRNKLFGAFTLYADEPNSFSAEEIALLEKITENIAFSLENILKEEERQVVETELRISEKRYKTLFEKASDGILIMNGKGKIISLNESFARMHGYTVKELLNINVKSLDTPAIAKILPKMIRRVLAGENIQMDVDHFHKKGHIITFAISASLVQVGKETFIQSFYTDITQRRMTEKKLRQLSMAVEQSSASIVITDTNGNIEYVNSKFVELTGYGYIEVIGKNPRILKSGYTSGEDYKKLWNTISNGNSWHGLLHNKKKNGEFYWESASISPMFDEHGKITHFLAIKEDITEQKKADETLFKYSVELETTNKLMKETLERFELVNKATQDVIWEWDLQTGHIYRSNSFAKKYGYTARQIRNDRAWSQEHLHPMDRDRVMGIIDHCLKNRLTNWQDEYRFLSGDGTYKYVYDRGFILFDENGNPRRMIGAMSDLTEKVNLQSALEVQEIRQQKQLLQVNILAHEEEKNELGLELHDNIVQMLATVKLYLGMIKSGFGTPEDDLIGKSYHHLNVTLDELRKLSHSLVSPSLSDIKLEEALQELLRGASLGKNININLTVDKAFNESKIDKAKELMLYRIVQEQINNIFKYANAQNVYITIKIEGNNLDLTVEDNGDGFDVTKKATGIGLRNIKTRVEYYTGSMNIISAPGEGCTLKVSVPMISESE